MTTEAKPEPKKEEAKKRIDHVVHLTVYEGYPIPEITGSGDITIKQIMNDLLHACLGIWSGVVLTPPPANPPQKGVESEQAKQT